MEKEPNFFVKHIGKITSLLALLTAITLTVSSCYGLIAINPFQIFFATLLIGLGVAFFASGLPQKMASIYAPFSLVLCSVGAFILLVGWAQWYFVLIPVVIGVLAIIATIAEIYLLNICCASSTDDVSATESYEDFALRMKLKEQSEQKNTSQVEENDTDKKEDL